MKLRDKALLSVVFVILALGFMLYAFTEWVFIDCYNQLDENRAYQTVQRLYVHLDDALQCLDSLCRSYSSLNKLHQTLSVDDSGVPSVMFSSELIERHHLDLVLLLDSSGRLIFKDGASREKYWFEDSVTNFVSQLNEFVESLIQKDAESVRGYISPGNISVMFSVCRISSFLGDGVDGLLVFATEVDTELIAYITGSHETDFTITIPDDSWKLRNHAARQDRSDAGWISRRDATTIYAVNTVKGIHGKPAFICETPVPRESFMQGRAVLAYFLCILFVTGLVLGLVILLLLERGIFARLSRLGSQVVKIGVNGNLSERIEDKGDDEINSLTKEIDNMLLALECASQELDGSEKRFQELFDNIQSGVTVFVRDDSAGEFLIADMNVATQKMDDLKLSQIKGRSWLDVYPEICDSDLSRTMMDVWENGSAMHIDAAYFDGEHMNGWRDFQICRLPSKEIVVLCNDVTGELAVKESLDQKERELYHAQKMEAIGRLAGGIAHDFNNILTVVNGVSEMALMFMDEDNPLRTDMTEINKAGERAKALTSQLLEFSREQIANPEVIDMNIVVNKMETMLTQLIGEKIELKILSEVASATVIADSGQMEQVFMNLAVNAMDAMPNGGLLKIEISIMDINQSYIDKCRLVESLSAEYGEYVVVKISDTGVGMDPKTMQRVCEPFFTTKEVGKGTGLGLSTSCGIMRHNNGFMWFESVLGEGTCVTLCLPFVESDIVFEQQDGDIVLAQGNETVLFVEDEGALRDLASRFLRHVGFNVLTASNAEEAIEVESRCDSGIDLLVTDMVMPGMSGTELWKKLHAKRKSLKVVFITGYTAGIILKDKLPEEYAVLLRKPFSMNDLASEIRNVLDKQIRRGN